MIMNRFTMSSGEIRLGSLTEMIRFLPSCSMKDNEN